ncbi:MAG: hypothetical protein ACR2HD_03325 [Solirubrobacteraceae bacterium]|nr:MAG: hypothetical protein DLM63_11930 [Solirubrobacterales bacterium]
MRRTRLLAALLVGVAAAAAILLLAGSGRPRRPPATTRLPASTPTAANAVRQLASVLRPRALVPALPRWVIGPGVAASVRRSGVYYRVSLAGPGFVVVFGREPSRGRGLGCTHAPGVDLCSIRRGDFTYFLRSRAVGPPRLTSAQLRSALAHLAPISGE